ncbi:MAG: hypothetical protein WDN76_13655 [Alphaproteobacteria bacterium]
MRLALETDRAIAHFSELLDGPRNVDDPHFRHALDCPGGGLRERTGQRRRLPILHDDRARAEAAAETKQRADILWIGNRIQHQHGTTVCRSTVLNNARFKLGSADRNALVHRAGRQQTVKRFGFYQFEPDVGRQALGAVPGRHGALDIPFGVVQGG